MHEFNKLQKFLEFLNISSFFAAYGWYIVFGAVIFCIIKKNLQEKIDKVLRSWEDGKIKKDPDAYYAQEESRQAYLERVQKEYDEVKFPEYI
jgi:hypothetical protein